MKKPLTALLTLTLILTILPFSSVSAANRTEVIDIAKSQLGVPYRFGGTTTSGFDCSGFIRYVFNQVNIDLPRTSGEQYEVGEKVVKADLLPGDIVFFAGTYRAGISHSGIYIGDNKFISATSSRGIKIDSLDSSYWGPKFVVGKRVIEDEVLPLGQFHDVTEEHLAYEAIKELSEQKIINGFEFSYFKPEDSVTRGQAAAIINRALNLPEGELNSFNDVAAGMVFAKDIAAIKQAGIINGFPDGTFKPNEVMTRAQMAAIVQRAFEIEQEVKLKIASLPYNDVTSDYWAYSAIMMLNSIDQTSMFKTSSFKATAEASRADYAAAIYNAILAKK